jgi:FkbM family methyltransferase
MEYLMGKSVQTRYGELLVPDIVNDLIINHLEQFGEWAFTETSFISSLLSKDARVLDIGACFGTFSLGLAEGFPQRTFTLIEANPITFPFLQANIDEHLAKRALCFDQLLIPEGERVDRGWISESNIGATSFVEPTALTTDVVEIEVVCKSVTLSQVLSESGPFELIKLDIEGMEESIASTFDKLPDLQNSILWIECNESPKSLELCQHLLKLDRSVNYCAFPVFNSENFNGSTRSIYPFAFESGLLIGDIDEPKPNSDKGLSPIFRPINSTFDLKEAMWHTPRWGLRGWENLQLNSLIAQATHDLAGEERGSYLSTPGEIERIGNPLEYTSKETLLMNRQNLLERELARLKGIISDQSKVIDELGLETLKRS